MPPVTLEKPSEINEAPVDQIEQTTLNVATVAEAEPLAELPTVQPDLTDMSNEVATAAIADKNKVAFETEWNKNQPEDPATTQAWNKELGNNSQSEAFVGTQVANSDETPVAKVDAPTASELISPNVNVAPEITEVGKAALAEQVQPIENNPDSN